MASSHASLGIHGRRGAHSASDAPAGTALDDATKSGALRRTLVLPADLQDPAVNGVRRDPE